MIRFNVYFHSGENQIIAADDIEIRDGATVLVDKTGIVAWFPPNAVRYIKTYADPVVADHIVKAPPLLPAEPMPEPTTIDGHPPSYTIAVAARILGAGHETLRSRIKEEVYDGCWKHKREGVKGPPQWMIPLTSLGLEYPAPTLDISQ